MAEPISTPRRLWLVARSAVFWLWQIAVTILMGAPVILGGLLSFRLGYFFSKIWIYLNLLGLRYLCGVTWSVQGKEHIPDKPCLVLSKHQSTWETYFLPLTFYPAVYVAKRSLIWIPIFGWALYALRFIMIDRKSGRSAIAQMVEQTRDRIARGRWVVIFPEGTRRPVNSIPNYRIGGAVVAEKVGCPIVPVALNAGEYWPRMGFIKWPGQIQVRIGPPIEPQGRSAAELIRLTENWIESRMAEITVPDRFPYQSRRHPGPGL